MAGLVRYAAVMQIGYFDESGIHGATKITLISGFVARLEDWPRVSAIWKAQLERDGVSIFHYKDCVDQRKEYAGWDWKTQCQPHLRRMSDVIRHAPVGGVSAGFIGDWAHAIEDRPDLRERFPSCYSFCFEALIRKIRAEMNHHGQPDIILVFSRQREYQGRAIEVWKWHQERGHWAEIKDVTYGEPRDIMGLQMADMLAYETHRYQLKGGDTWRTLPLLSQLIAKHERDGTTLYDTAYDQDQVRKLRRAD